MAKSVYPQSRGGTYILVLRLEREIFVEAGKLGRVGLDAGWYAYCGSAFGPGGVAARCRHHRKVSARPHWHVDYLRAVAQLEQIWFSHLPERLEHAWAGLLGASRGARAIHPGFGSSDCRCVTHLYHFPRTMPSFRGFCQRFRRDFHRSGRIFRELVVY